MNDKSNQRTQNVISSKVLDGSDLGERIEEIVNDVAEKTGFRPINLLGKSAWWGSTEIGAFHYLGSFEGNEAMLKVQGVKPETSEIFMIQSFAEQNKSLVIRPPHLYTTLPWDDEKSYEALVMENVGTNKVVNVPTNQQEVERFFELYQEYRKNCRNVPWLLKPEQSISEAIQTKFEKWRKVTYKIYPEHPNRASGDTDIIARAIKILTKGYKKVDWEFQHGHLSDSDFYNVNDQVVVLSNLYWSWRAPYYDSIFAYHWFMYHLNDVENISPKEVEDQKNLWLENIYRFTDVKGGKEKLLKLALLERAAAGLNLDALSMDPKRPITKHLINKTREEVVCLTEELEG